MNISSIIVKVKPEDYDNAFLSLEESGICDVYFGDKDKGIIIITIEGESSEEEVTKLAQIQDMPMILDAQMHMSYCEDEVEKMSEYIELKNTVDELNKDKKAEEIKSSWDMIKRK